MKLRMLLLGGPAVLIAAGVWTYEVPMAQLNNAITLQRCVLEIEHEQRLTGRLPHSVTCIDYWGAPIAYVVRDGTYLLVSAGADGQPDVNYGASAPANISSASTCLTRGADTVFVGRHPVRFCLK
jgi:hypothetical protein